MRKFIISILFCFIATTVQGWSTLPEIHKKSGTFIQNKVESTPVVWDNKVVVVVFERLGTSGTYISIYDLFTKSLITHVPFNYGLGCAIVVDGTLYIFGTSNWGISGNSVVVTSTIDLINWTLPITAFTAPPGVTIFNTSVAPAETGYVMAYETNEFTPFTIRFAVSSDLLSWAQIGNLFQSTTYAACPTVRYVNGYYQILYLRNVNPYVTFVARTQDFINYEYFNGNVKWPNYIQFLSPTSFPTEGTNNSDVDFVEWNGTVIGTYAIGDQVTWMNIRTWVYFGTMRDLFYEFWP